MTDFFTSVWVETAFQKYLSVLLIYILLNPSMTNMLFLPTESLLNQKLNKAQEVKKFLPSIKKLSDVKHMILIIIKRNILGTL